ncbi:amino acid ABC transporter permease [Vallitaleaceae bacterium 9-2]
MIKNNKTVNFMIALCLYLGLFYFVTTQTIGGSLDFAPYYTYRKVIFSGWLRTIEVSVLGVLLSLMVGLILYFMNESNILAIKYVAVIHKTIIFGTPLLVIAIVSYYYIGNAFSIDSKLFVGVVTLGLYIGAYISDIYKGAIESIHINQWQTAKMFGFTKVQTYRYVIFPQVLKSILPPLAGQFALTIKGSALLSYMALNEFFNEINVVQSNTFRFAEGFIVVSIGYWIITVPLIVFVRKLEERLHVRIIK